ncbi:hypothetical protein IBTHAUMO2_1120008 [Nitrosopumilaceae archaeon]|nr:hypothetical protein IBTHAUMO2_1120008 [Nitrosopumilaceae archaeon]
MGRGGARVPDGGHMEAQKRPDPEPLGDLMDALQ